MVIGVLHLEFTLHGNDSLKGKRSVAQSVKHKLRKRFNVAVAEVDAQESHTRLVLACVSVSGCKRHLERRMRNALSMVEDVAPEELTYSDVEYIEAS